MAADRLPLRCLLAECGAILPKGRYRFCCKRHNSTYDARSKAAREREAWFGSAGLVEITCFYKPCGRKFTPRNIRSLAKVAFCSQKCRKRAWADVEIRTTECDRCGSEIDRTKRRTDTNYCSAKCQRAERILAKHVSRVYARSHAKAARSGVDLGPLKVEGIMNLAYGVLKGGR